MSSPTGGTGSALGQPQMAQTIGESGASNESDGVSIQPMRLKVLYTFDDQNKTNCLARWPHVLEVQTVAMDETTRIGVVELKTCIQAIVQCSPELVAKLGQDYTVYAYDYSEYDNPLVGQGMLSWALAAASPTPGAPAHQSRQLITGRVCKNIQGLFSNGVAETLEVKLRLVPVPTVLQSEYLSSMEKYRDLSKAIPPGFDHNEWFSFLQTNPNVAQMANKINAPVVSNHQRNGSSMEVMNQLLSPSLQQPSIDLFNNVTIEGSLGSESRSATPAVARKNAQKVSRPPSRASVKRGRKPKSSTTVGGDTSGYEEGTDGDEGPVAKKRAKPTKADWTRKTVFGSGSDSLRVAASTSGSLRVFRPIAMGPGGGVTNASHLQEFPRAPTPVPGTISQPQARAISQNPLRQESFPSLVLETSQQTYNSPYSQDNGSQESHEPVRLSIESAMTSPERNNSPGFTPMEFGSSPPVLRTDTYPPTSPAPSSPVLPTMPRPNTDSGFMSGDTNDLFEDDEDMRPIDDEAISMPVKENPRRTMRAAPRPQAPIHHGFAIEEVTPGPPELLPTKMFLVAPVQRKANPKPKATTSRNVRSNSTKSDGGRPVVNPQSISVSQPSSLREITPVMPPPIVNTALAQSNLPSGSDYQQRRTSIPNVPGQVNPFPLPVSKMSRTASTGSLSFPSITASDPVLAPASFQRSQTWSEALHPGTDAPTANTDMYYSTQDPGQHTRSAIAKKNNILMRLEAAIANGEMPPFCNNCGAIKTPTWRRAYSQDHRGDPGYHEYSDEPGKVTAIDITERDTTGKPIAYKLIKKSLGAEENPEAFTELLLCNPCGIWVSKYKTQRPEDKWQKEGKEFNSNEKRTGDKDKRKRQYKPRKSRTGNYEATSEANLPSDAFAHVDSDWPMEPPGTQQELQQEPGHYMQHQVQQEPKQQEAPTNQAPVTVTAEQQQDISQRQRASSMRPAKKIKAMTSGAASAALRRAIQSSPARWVGTRHSPIELEDDDLGFTRRLLFPSPRKDGSPKILGEVATNVLHAATDFRSPSARKSQFAEGEVSDKENCPPSPLFGDDADADLIKLFEEELTRPSRPTTPVQKTPTANLFKTPTRPTPSHRPITRSQSRSVSSTNRILMHVQQTPTKTPGSSARRRSPRHRDSVLESPFTAQLNRLLGNAHDCSKVSPGRHLDLGIDFSALPDLGHSTNNHHGDAINFHLPEFDPNHDFFSTDIPMPSSPPRLFDLYEDPMTMGMQNMNSMDHRIWSDFTMHDGAMLPSGLMVDESGHATIEMSTMNVAGGMKIKVETALETATEAFDGDSLHTQ